MANAQTLTELWSEFRDSCDSTGCSDGLIVADGTLLQRLDEMIQTELSSQRIVVHLQEGVFREITGLPAGIKFEIRDRGNRSRHATADREYPVEYHSTDQSPACDRWRCEMCLFEVEMGPSQCGCGVACSPGVRL